MSVAAKDIIFFGSANMQEDDTSTPQGGAEDTQKKISWKDVENVQVEAVSESAADTTQTVTITGRDAPGAKIEEVITLTGQTPAQAGSPTTFERLIKAVKSATCVGNVAVMAVTNERDPEQAQGGGADYLDLAAGAAQADGYYVGMLCRSTSGTGANQIRPVARYDGTLNRIYFRDVATPFDATTFYEIAPGMVFDKIASPAIEVMEVRAIFALVAAEAEGGSDIDRYEKVFAHNINGTKALTEAKIAELQAGIEEGANDFLAFDLESSLDGSDTATNRVTAPGGYTFDSTEKDVANSANLSPDAAQGVWLKFTLPADTAAQKSFYRLRVSGQST